MTAVDDRNGHQRTRGTKAAGAAHRTVRTIAETIVSGVLNPGERLPTERALAEQLQVSRSTVREAIRSLEAMGVVEVRRGDGSYVTSLEPQYLLDTAAFVTRLLRDHTVLEMFEVRAILEFAATAMAAARMTEADHAELRHQVRRIEEANSVEDILSADLAFHSLIAAASGNAMLVSLLETFSAKTYRARYLKSKIEFRRIHGQPPAGARGRVGRHRLTRPGSRQSRRRRPRAGNGKMAAAFANGSGKPCCASEQAAGTTTGLWSSLRRNPRAAASTM